MEKLYRLMFVAEKVAQGRQRHEVLGHFKISEDDHQFLDCVDAERKASFHREPFITPLLYMIVIWLKRLVLINAALAIAITLAVVLF